MLRLTVILVAVGACVPPAAESPAAPALSQVEVGDCRVAVAAGPVPAAAAGAPGAAPEAGDEVADAGPAPASLDDAQGYLTTVVEPALDRNREAIGSCPGDRSALLVFDVTFGVSITGEIDDATVDGRDPGVGSCLAGIFRGLALAPPPNRVVARCRVRIAPRS